MKNFKNYLVTIIALLIMTSLAAKAKGDTTTCPGACDSIPWTYDSTSMSGTVGYCGFKIFFKYRQCNCPTCIREFTIVKFSVITGQPCYGMEREMEKEAIRTILYNSKNIWNIPENEYDIQSLQKSCKMWDSLDLINCISQCCNSTYHISNGLSGAYLTQMTTASTTWSCPIQVQNHPELGYCINICSNSSPSLGPLGGGFEQCPDNCFWTIKGNFNVDSSNFLGTIGNVPLIFCTAYQERMKITASGEVKIKGTLYAGEIFVKPLEEFWPDDVFKKDYKLRSIKEIKEYITANGHLPDIPSSQEIKENGLGISSMQAKMMTKIEEFTLYLIKLSKENDDLKNRVRVLELNKSSK